MEDLLVHNFEIKSHTGSYQVIFDNNLLDSNTIENLGTHYIIDRNVFKLFSNEMLLALSRKEVVLIDATEETKSYRGVEPIITQLLGHNMKRDSVLVAIGGGITQDITCFIATTFMRGVKWTFVPTTLLAQADSCIGSKSSINFDKYKNLLGSFNPPNEIYVCDQFLTSLTDKDFKSGIGEIVKLLIIGGTLVSSDEITRENISDHLIRYQLELVGKTWEDAEADEQWFYNITMTQDQFDEFMKYALPLVKKVFRCNKLRAQKTMDWFNLQFGLRIFPIPDKFKIEDNDNK